MPSAQDSSRLAVLIDGDNTTPTIVEALLAEIAKYGSATVKRAYGDWTTPQLKGWKDAINAHAIQPVQQFAYTTGKNATDSALIIDAMDLLYTGNLDGFCLVSSDSDFTKLASRLRESGKTVYGFGEPRTPQALVVACDKFVYLDVLRRPDKPKEPTEGEPAPTAPARRSSGDLRGDAKLVKLLREGIDAASDDDGWANLGGRGVARRQAGAGLRLPQLGLRQARRPGDRDGAVRGEAVGGPERPGAREAQGAGDQEGRQEVLTVRGGPPALGPGPSDAAR